MGTTPPRRTLDLNLNLVVLLRKFKYNDGLSLLSFFLTFMSYLPKDPKEWYLLNVVPPPLEIERIQKAEQGTDVWHRARAVRASGSRVGDMLGLGFMSTNARRLTELFIWPKPLTSPWVKWGSEHEVFAQRACEEVLRTRFSTYDVVFDYPGGIIIRGDEWFIASVDGIATLKDRTTGDAVESILLEFKCPKRMHPEIRPGYYAQVQSYMGFLRQHDASKYGTMKRCIFGQWTPSKMCLAEYAFNQAWFDQLKEMARRVYFYHIVPRLILKDAGLLKEGECKLKASPVGRTASAKRMLPQTPTKQNQPSTSNTPLENIGFVVVSGEAKRFKRF